MDSGAWWRIWRARYEHQRLLWQLIVKGSIVCIDKLPNCVGEQQAQYYRKLGDHGLKGCTERKRKYATGIRMRTTL